MMQHHPLFPWRVFLHQITVANYCFHLLQTLQAEGQPWPVWVKDKVKHVAAKIGARSLVPCKV